jgi:hypothetical protein
MWWNFTPSGIPQVAENGSGFSRCWQRRNLDSSELWVGHGFSRAAQGLEKCGL